MTTEDAMRWVDEHKGLILKRAKMHYVKHAPYDVDDYIQDAYAAAIEAVAVIKQNPRLQFEGVFRTIFYQNVAKVTPWREEGRDANRERRANDPDYKVYCEKNGIKVKEGKSKPVRPSGEASMSFPSSNRVDLPLEIIPHKKRSRKINIENVFGAVKNKLSPREREVMELSLGLTLKGVLSPNEIAKHLGISRMAVRTLEGRALQKVSQSKCKVVPMKRGLRSEGQTAFDEAIASAIIEAKESEGAGDQKAQISA